MFDSLLTPRSLQSFPRTFSDVSGRLTNDKKGEQHKLRELPERNMPESCVRYLGFRKLSGPIFDLSLPRSQQFVFKLRDFRV